MDRNEDPRDQIIKQNNPRATFEEAMEKLDGEINKAYNFRDPREAIIRRNNPTEEEKRMNLEAGWYCEKENGFKTEPMKKWAKNLKEHGLEEIAEYAKAFEAKERVARNTAEHGPVLAKFIEDGREHEAEQIKKNVQKMMERGMLSEEEEMALKEKFGLHKKEYEAPKCEVLEPDKTEEWKGHIPEGDLGVTDYSIPGNICLSLRKHGWFVCHKDETAALWESRYDEVKESQDALFKDKVKEYLNTNTVNYVSTGEEPEGLPVITLKEYSFDDILWRLREIHARKNHDYGNAAHESYKEFGLVSYVIRLNDKMKRLKSLTKPGAEQQVADEKIEDTLMDLAAYAIMAIESLHSEE